MVTTFSFRLSINLHFYVSKCVNFLHIHIPLLLAYPFPVFDMYVRYVIGRFHPFTGHEGPWGE